MEDKMSFASPEAEIRYLEQKILEKKSALESMPHRDIVSDVLKEHGNAVAPPPAANPAQSNSASDVLPSDVAGLVQIAFQNGITEAVRRARATGNPYLIDSFHDALVDRFLDEMKQKGILSAHG